jgi:DNA-binding NarL/FixJ family response regulator
MRVLLADDQLKIRSALKLLLEQELGLRVVGEVAKVESLIPLANKTNPDVVLVDWKLLGCKATGLISALREKRPRLQVIALSGRPESRQAALEAGVDTFISKVDPPEQLLSALKALGLKAEG